MNIIPLLLLSSILILALFPNVEAALSVASPTAPTITGKAMPGGNLNASTTYYFIAYRQNRGSYYNGHAATAATQEINITTNTTHKNIQINVSAVTDYPYTRIKWDTRSMLYANGTYKRWSHTSNGTDSSLDYGHRRWNELYWTAAPTGTSFLLNKTSGMMNHDTPFNETYSRSKPGGHPQIEWNDITMPYPQLFRRDVGIPLIKRISSGSNNFADIKVLLDTNKYLRNVSVTTNNSILFVGDITGSYASNFNWVSVSIIAGSIGYGSSYPYQLYNHSTFNNYNKRQWYYPNGQYYHSSITMSIGETIILDNVKSSEALEIHPGGSSLANYGGNISDVTLADVGTHLDILRYTSGSTAKNINLKRSLMYHETPSTAGIKKPNYMINITNLKDTQSAYDISVSLAYSYNKNISLKYNYIDYIGDNTPPQVRYSSQIPTSEVNISVNFNSTAKFYLTNTLGTAISGANIKVYDKNNVLRQQTSTDSTGFARASIMFYTSRANNTAGSPNYATNYAFMPHKITIEKDGYLTTTYLNQNITKAREYRVMMQPYIFNMISIMNNAAEILAIK